MEDLKRGRERGKIEEKSGRFEDRKKREEDLKREREGRKEGGNNRFVKSRKEFK